LQPSIQQEINSIEFCGQQICEADCSTPYTADFALIMRVGVEMLSGVDCDDGNCDGDDNDNYRNDDGFGDGDYRTRRTMASRLA
jgi:hypothetical protein